MKQWIERQRGEGIKPNAFQDLVPACMTDETSTEQNASDFKLVHDSGFVDCGESHFNHFNFTPDNHIVAPPRDSVINFNQQPSARQRATLPLDSAAQRPSETRQRIEFEQTHRVCADSVQAIVNNNTIVESRAAPARNDLINTLPSESNETAPHFNTHSENDNGNEGVKQSQGRCGPPLYPNNIVRDCRKASPELRSESRHGIFDVIRLRNNREISVPAPTQKGRGRGEI